MGCGEVGYQDYHSSANEDSGKQEGLGRIDLSLPDGDFCRLNGQGVGNYILWL